MGYPRFKGYRANNRTTMNAPGSYSAGALWCCCIKGKYQGVICHCETILTISL